jgi:polyisoprenoid-binding protein YceI
MIYRRTQIMNRISTIFLATLIFMGFHSISGSEPDVEKSSDAPQQLKAKTLKSRETPGTILFFARNSQYQAKGRFKRWHFTRLEIPQGNDGLEGGKAEIEIDLTSLTEKNPKLTAHLKSADFFDVIRFPKARVKIFNVKAKGKNSKNYSARAQVSVRNAKMSAPVNFRVTNDNPLTIEGTINLRRTQLDIGKPVNPRNPRSIQDQVKIRFKTKLPAG